MRLLSLRALAAALFALTLPLAACDETGAAGGSVEERVTNARLARQGGDYETAVRLLEAAYAEAPQNARVRAEYAVTILERDELNLLDLDRLAAFLTDAAGATAAPAPSPARGGATCSFATDPTATPFRPEDYVGFPDLAAHRATVQQTLALLDPVVPDALQDFSLCTGIEDGPDGPALAYDRAAALAEMRALGLSDTQIADVLAANALARFLNAYLFLTIDVPQETQWFRTEGGSGIGVCAADPDALLEQAEAAVADLGEAAYSIDLRAGTVGGSASQELVDLVLEGYTEIRDGIGTYCAG